MDCTSSLLMSICFKKPVAKLENAIIENPTSVSEKIAALCSEVGCESTLTVFLCILGIGFQEPPPAPKKENRIPGVRDAASSVISVYFVYPVPGTDNQNRIPGVQDAASSVSSVYFVYPVPGTDSPRLLKY